MIETLMIVSVSFIILLLVVVLAVAITAITQFVADVTGIECWLRGEHDYQRTYRHSPFVEAWGDQYTKVYRCRRCGKSKVKTVQKEL